MLSPLGIDGPRMKRQRNGDGNKVVESDDCVREHIRFVTQRIMGK